MQRGKKSNVTLARCTLDEVACTLVVRDEIILGFLIGLMGPMGFPWSWESLG